MNKKTYANSEVLDFYRTLPFNQKNSLEEEINGVLKRTPKNLYPGLSQILNPSVSVLEVGCGVGWLCNSISFLYKSSVLGIDFNSVAISRAQEVAKRLGLKTQFRTEDLFLYRPDIPFDVVLSFGVLHHTNNCKAAIRCICENFVRKGGYVMIGLYHKYGRQPFLDEFNNMKERGATEDEMFNRYKTLHPYIKDETQVLSWFRDQVLHPHETQHTLEETIPILKELNMDLVSTSINHFQPILSTNDLIKKESQYTQIATDYLNDNKYFPGFFIFIAKKK